MMSALSYRLDENGTTKTYQLEFETYQSSFEIIKEVVAAGGDLLPVNAIGEVKTLEELQQLLTERVHHVLYAGVFDSEQALFYELGDDDFLRDEIEEYEGERFMLYFCETTQQYFLLMLTYEYL